MRILRKAHNPHKLNFKVAFFCFHIFLYSKNARVSSPSTRIRISKIPVDGMYVSTRLRNVYGEATG